MFRFIVDRTDRHYRTTGRVSVLAFGGEAGAGIRRIPSRKWRLYHPRHEVGPRVINGLDRRTPRLPPQLGQGRQVGLSLGMGKLSGRQHAAASAEGSMASQHPCIADGWKFVWPPGSLEQVSTAKAVAPEPIPIAGPREVFNAEIRRRTAAHETDETPIAAVLSVFGTTF